MKAKIGKYYKNSDGRRVNIEIDGYDIWGLDHTLALVILPALCLLKENMHGVPSEFAEIGGEDYLSQKSFDFYTEDTKELYEQRYKEWEEVLDKMIWSFQQIALDDDYNKKYHHGEMKMGWIKSDKLYPNPVTGVLEPTYQMVDENPDEHWYDHVGHMLHEERIQEGLNLFGKYYRSLWN